jgi:hypothetical protein
VNVEPQFRAAAPTFFTQIRDDAALEIVGDPQGGGQSTNERKRPPAKERPSISR